MARSHRRVVPVEEPLPADGGPVAVALRMDEVPVVVASKRRGRPKVEDPGSAVTTWLKPREHDYLVHLARDRAQSVSSLVRSLLMLRIKP
jgi:hypothetical protein